MNILDLKNQTTAFTVLKSQAVTSDTNGPGVDLRGYLGSVLIIANVAAATAGTAPTMDIKIQDSADNSSFADVSGYTFTQVTTTDSLQTLNVDTRNVRRYIRAVADIGGTTPSFPVAIQGLGFKQVV